MSDLQVCVWMWLLTRSPFSTANIRRRISLHNLCNFVFLSLANEILFFLGFCLCYLGRPWEKNIAKAQRPRVNSKNILGLAMFMVLMNCLSYAWIHTPFRDLSLLHHHFPNKTWLFINDEHVLADPHLYFCSFGMLAGIRKYQSLAT